MCKSGGSGGGEAEHFDREKCDRRPTTTGDQATCKDAELMFVLLRSESAAWKKLCSYCPPHLIEVEKYATESIEYIFGSISFIPDSLYHQVIHRFGGHKDPQSIAFITKIS